MPRTTLALEPALLRELKLRAARQGKTMQAIVNELLRQALRSSPGPRFRLEIEGWKGQQDPGVDLFDRDSIFRALEGR